MLATIICTCSMFLFFWEFAYLFYSSTGCYIMTNFPTSVLYLTYVTFFCKAYSNYHLIFTWPKCIINLHCFPSLAQDN